MKRNWTRYTPADLCATAFARLVLSASILGAPWVASAAAEAADRPPNLVLIMADDLGYETIAANGGTSYQTPELDRLAATGVRFEHCYVQPLCTPTRVQLMTGASNVRNYLTFGTMDPSLTTFANLLRQAGYATCIVGKWQLGRDPALPDRFGFEEACLWQHLRRPPRYANPGLEMNGKQHDYTGGEYGPDLVEQYAEDFITRHRDRPFLLYYPMLLTHAPYQPTPDSPDWNPQARGEARSRDQRHFGEMVSYMDKLVGKLIGHLESEGLRQQTLVMFLGDNGTGRGVISRMGERSVEGGKGMTNSRGMHVPLVVNWPGQTGPPRVCGDLVDSTDFLPTLCAAAGVLLPKDLPCDGRSFLPQIKGQAGEPREWIYCWYSPRGDVPREFAFDQSFKRYSTGEFFDLKSDPDETKPLAIAALGGAAAEAAERLGNALAGFRDARPPKLLEYDRTAKHRRGGDE